MIPPNYIPSDPSRESERTKAARALVVECIGSRNKVAMRPRDSSDMPAPGVIYTEEINRYLAAHGFDDYTVEYNATGPAALGLRRAQERMHAGGMTMDEANRRAWLRRPGESSTIPAGFENRRGEVELTYSGIDQRISAIYTPDHDEPNRLRDHDRSPSP